MIIDKVSDLIVFKTLNNIKHGFLEITNFDGEVLKFGNPKHELKTSLIIKKPKIGPIITLPIEEITESFKEKTISD